MTPEQLRRLANLVDDLEMDGYRVTDAELLERCDDGIVAAVELSLPEGDDDATSASAGAAAAASGISAFPGRVPVSDDEDAVTEDIDDSQGEDDDEPENEAEDPDGDDAVELTDAEQDVVDVLEDEGELPRSEIKSLTERSEYISEVLSRLRDKDILEHRKDPEDGRRYLYSLARDDVVDGARGGPSHQPPDTSDIGAGDLTPAVRPLDEEEWTSVSEFEQRDQEETDMIQTSGFAAGDGESDDDRIHYPWVCSCGVVCQTQLEREIHRMEAHGDPQTRLNSLKQGKFVDLVRKVDSVTGLAESLDCSTNRTLRILGIYGLKGAVAGDGLPDDPTTTTDLLQLGSEAGPGERQQADKEVSPDA